MQLKLIQWFTKNCVRNPYLPFCGSFNVGSDCPSDFWMSPDAFSCFNLRVRLSWLLLGCRWFRAVLCSLPWADAGWSTTTAELPAFRHILGRLGTLSGLSRSEWFSWKVDVWMVCWGCWTEQIHAKHCTVFMVKHTKRRDAVIKLCWFFF